MKKALRDALAQVGTDEANFGLMRFPQRRGRHAVAAAARSGRWTHAWTLLPRDGGLGCRLTTQNNTTRRDRLRHVVRQRHRAGAAGRRSPSRRAALKPGAPPTSIRPTATSRDLQVDRQHGEPGDGRRPTTPDPELHANSVDAARAARCSTRACTSRTTSTRPRSRRRACRQNIVILATDGNDMCDNQRAGAALDVPDCAQTAQLRDVPPRGAGLQAEPLDGHLEG